MPESIPLATLKLRDAFDKYQYYRNVEFPTQMKMMAEFWLPILSNIKTMSNWRTTNWKIGVSLSDGSFIETNSLSVMSAELNREPNDIVVIWSVKNYKT